MKGARGSLRRIVERFGNRERLDGVAIYDARAGLSWSPPALATRLGTDPPPLDRSVFEGNGWSHFFGSGPTAAHLYAVPIRVDGSVVGALAVFHDASYIEAQNTQLWRDTFMHVLMQMLLIAAITVLVVRWSVERPIARLAQWLHDLRAGTVASNPDLPNEQVLRPLAHEATHLATSLQVARASAEEEAGYAKPPTHSGLPNDCGCINKRRSKVAVVCGLQS